MCVLHFNEIFTQNPKINKTHIYIHIPHVFYIINLLFYFLKYLKNFFIFIIGNILALFII